MPTIVRKSSTTLLETRREILHAVSWQVRSNVWSPPTDRYETEEAYVVRVEIAGMREEDFEVSLENNTLLISGSRPDLTETACISANGNTFWKICNCAYFARSGKYRTGPRRIQRWIFNRYPPQSNT